MLTSLGHIIEEATDDRIAVELLKVKEIDLVLGEVDPLDERCSTLPTYVDAIIAELRSFFYSQGPTPKEPRPPCEEVPRESSTIQFRPPSYVPLCCRGSSW